MYGNKSKCKRIYIFAPVSILNFKLTVSQSTEWNTQKMNNKKVQMTEVAKPFVMYQTEPTVLLLLTLS